MIIATTVPTVANGFEKPSVNLSSIAQAISKNPPSTRNDPSQNRFFSLRQGRPRQGLVLDEVVLDRSSNQGFSEVKAALLSRRVKCRQIRLPHFVA